MSKLNTLVEGAILGAASIATNVVTDTKNVIDTVAGGEILPVITDAASQAASIPSPDTISTVMNLVTQLAILVTTIWRMLKKDKPKQPNTTK